MIPYDSTFSPPAPVLSLTLRGPKDPTRAVDVRMQVDTGADLTLIPEEVVSTLSLKEEDETPVADYRGNVASLPVFYVTIQIDQYAIKDVRVITTSDKVGILGRNVLRAFTLTLHGKDQTFDIADP